MQLAERTMDAAMAENSVPANRGPFWKPTRAGGHASECAYYEARLREARRTPRQLNGYP